MPHHRGLPHLRGQITHGHDLLAAWVIHTVGPVWQGGTNNETGLLASCSRNSRSLACENNIAFIVFPAISAGAYGFPVDRAAVTAMGAASTFLAQNTTITSVVFCCFSAELAQHHENTAAVFLH